MHVQGVSKRMTVESAMKKKQIVVQERCLACGNGSPAMPPARVRRKFHNIQFQLVHPCFCAGERRQRARHWTGGFQGIR
jgi:hypothetical protein